MTLVHLLMIVVFVLGGVAGALLTYQLMFQASVDAAVAANLQGFEKGIKHVAEELEAMHQEERRRHARQLASSLTPALAQYGKILILKHYACDEGCELDHQEEVLEIERNGVTQQ